MDYDLKIAKGIPSSSIFIIMYAGLYGKIVEWYGGSSGKKSFKTQVGKDFIKNTFLDRI